MSQPSIWALLDDRAGHNAQTVGIAQALEMAYEPKAISYSWLASLPNSLLGSSLLGIGPNAINPPWPDLVIATGRRMVPVMRHIKKHSHDTVLVQCMWPERLDPFDLIVAPEHDNPPDAPNILTTTGALHGINHVVLDEAATQFESLVAEYPKPHIGVLIGGNSKHGKFTRADIERLCDLSELMLKGGTLFITTSRRTPDFAAQIITDRLTCPYYLHDWNSADENPYKGLLALCDGLIVTADSISMMSEACYRGVPVFLFEPANISSDKHQQFLENLTHSGYAQILTASANLADFVAKPLDEAEKIVSLVKDLLNRKKKIAN